MLVYHDMEGLAGQDNPLTYRFDHPTEYAKGRQMLVADINAVIAGLFDGGATEVNVIDAHGSGNPEPDIPAGALDPRAKQIFRDKPFRGYVDLVEPDRYDAVAAVAMHSKTGSRGFAAHTITLGMALELNGKEITESELVGYSWGRVNVPLIFVSGDDRLANDLKVLPWIEFVTTKKATSSSTVELYPGRSGARRDEGRGEARGAEPRQGAGAQDTVAGDHRGSRGAAGESRSVEGLSRSAATRTTR